VGELYWGGGTALALSKNFEKERLGEDGLVMLQEYCLKE
jgi:hypothetical protein